MMHRALGIAGLCGLVCFGCANASGGSGATAEDGGGGSSGGVGSSGAGGSSSGTTGSSSGVSSSGSGITAKSLIGTWDLTGTAIGSVGGGPGSPLATIVIGQDSLTVTDSSFTLTAVRTGNTVAYTDMAPGTIVLNATQTAAAFDTGILPFNLGGTWAMQIVQGATTVETCTLSVTTSEIDGACHVITQGIDFSFTTTKMSSAASVLGDFGGKWMNNWTWPGTSGGTYPCELDFIGSSITTCMPGDASMNGNALQDITFTYDGANTVSGIAQSYAEYSATRQ
jgi:hypothetical protein